MILHFYFARRFMGWLIICFIAIFALFALIDLFEHTRRFADRGVDAGGIIELVLLKTPQVLNQVLPLMVLLATVAFFLSLARTSELVATRASGRSAFGAVAAPIALVLVLGILATTTLNPIVAATSKRYGDLVSNYRSGEVSALSISDEGLWLREGTDEGHVVIRAYQSNPDGTVMFDVTFLAYSADGEPVQRTHADSATLSDGEWLLKTVKVWPLKRGLNAEANATLHDTLVVASNLTVDRIRERFGHPSTVAIWQLPEFVRRLDQAGFSSLQHRVWMQSELAQPLFLVAMVLVAAAFTMRHTRFGGTGLALLAAILMGFALYFIRSFALILGENGQLPVYLAAWAPPIASILLAFGPLLHAEDG